MTRFLGVAVDPIEGATLLNSQMIGGRIARTAGVSLVFAQSAVPVSVTGTTSETVLAKTPIPAGAMAPNGCLRVRYLYSCTSNANTKTFTIRLTGTAMRSFSVTANSSVWEEINIWNRGALNNQVWQPGGAPAGNGGGGTSGANPGTSSVNMAALQNLIIAGSLANAADTITLEAYTVELLNP